MRQGRKVGAKVNKLVATKSALGDCATRNAEIVSLQPENAILKKVFR